MMVDEYFGVRSSEVANPAATGSPLNAYTTGTPRILLSVAVVAAPDAISRSNKDTMVDPNYDDGRGLYLDSLTVRTPVGFRDQIREAAMAAQVQPAEFIRRAIERQIAETRESRRSGDRSTLALAS